MRNATVRTSPISYSKVCDTFRPRRGQRAARRAALGGESLVYFDVFGPMPDGFVVELGSKLRPGRIKNRLCQPGCGEAGRMHVARADTVVLPHQTRGEFVQEVFTGADDLRVDRPRPGLAPGALSDGQLLGMPGKVARILNLLARGKRSEHL